MDKSKVNYDSDVLTLVKLVEERPCIWDKSCIKEPGERKRAWREICQHLQPRFDEMEPDEQTKFEEAYQMKWKNTRDAFIKSIRTNLTQQYKYHDNLQFLLKSLIQKEQSSLPSTPARESTSETRTNCSSSSSPRKKAASLIASKARKLKRRSVFPKITRVHSSVPPAPVEEEAHKVKRRSVSPKISRVHSSTVPSPPEEEASNPKHRSVLPKISRVHSSTSGPPPAPPKEELRSTSPVASSSTHVDSESPLMKNGMLDEDEAFFISIMPSIKKFSDDEKLDFRIGVLCSLREIHHKSNMEYNTSSVDMTNAGDAGVLYMTNGHFSDVKDEINIVE